MKAKNRITPFILLLLTIAAGAGVALTPVSEGVNTLACAFFLLMISASVVWLFLNLDLSVKQGAAIMVVGIVGISVIGSHPQFYAAEGFFGVIASFGFLVAFSALIVHVTHKKLGPRRAGRYRRYSRHDAGTKSTTDDRDCGSEGGCPGGD